MKNKNFVILGLLLIVISAMLILKIINIIPPILASLIVSWQALLVLIGLISLCYRMFFYAGVLIVTGVYFLLPKLYIAFNCYPNITDVTTRQLYWVAILLIAGLSLIFVRFNRWERKHQYGYGSKFSTYSGDSSGIQAIFGAINNIVVEKPFNGAKISAIFGAAILDLRNTTLTQPNAVVDIECIFAGTIILVPDNWRIINSSRAVFGGLIDKREKQQETNADCELIIKGEIVFGGVEIKSMLEEDQRTGQFRSYQRQEQKQNVEAEEIIESITVKMSNKVHILSTEEVLYIQADGDYVTIYTPSGKFIKEQTMKYFESALSPDRFVRVHRSYIVNVSQINCVESRGREVYYAILKDGTALRTSTTGYQILKSKLSI